MNFRYFVIISNMGKVATLSFEQFDVPFVTPKCFVPSLFEIRLVVLEEKFLNFVNAFSLFCNYHPLRKGMVLHLKILESPSPNDALCQVWLK